MDSATVIISTKTSGYQLRNFLIDKAGSENDIISIVFQLMYTLLCFSRINLKHNDLHFGNIFIDKRKLNKSFNYQLRSDMYVSTPQSLYVAKIYDFDRGSIYHAAVDRNLELDLSYCPQFNECNNINKRIDLFALISGLIYYKDYIPDIIKTWIISITSEEFRLEAKKRQFSQLWIPGRNISNSDLNTVEESMFKLLKQLDKHLVFHKSSDNLKDVYHLPNEFSFIYGNPIDNKTHVARNIEISNIGIDGKFSLEQIEKVNQLITSKSSIYPHLLKMYVLEFSQLNYDLLKNAEKLFSLFIKKKNPIHTSYTEYYAMCLVLSLPFFYKLSENTKYAFIRTFLNIRTEDSVLKAIEDDIWNIFNNELPIKMIRI